MGYSKHLHVTVSEVHSFCCPRQEKFQRSDVEKNICSYALWRSKLCLHVLLVCGLIRSGNWEQHVRKCRSRLTLKPPGIPSIGVWMRSRGKKHKQVNLYNWNLRGFSSVELGFSCHSCLESTVHVCLLKWGAIYCMFVNMEFIIYLCFKCTYKLLKCMSVFTRVYSLVCLQCVLPRFFVMHRAPEQSHNVLGLRQLAACFLFPFLPSVLMKSLYWIHGDLNIIHVHPRSLNTFRFYFGNGWPGVFVSVVLESGHCYCLHVCCLE